MALISYTPGGKTTLLSPGQTVGPTTGIAKVAGTAAQGTGGTLPIQPSGSYPAFGHMGQFADSGDVADCLNQLVARIEALEAIFNSNPAYGVVAT